jgi:hypothetical protein
MRGRFPTRRSPPGLPPSARERPRIHAQPAYADRPDTGRDSGHRGLGRVLVVEGLDVSRRGSHVLGGITAVLALRFAHRASLVSFRGRALGPRTVVVRAFDCRL